MENLEKNNKNFENEGELLASETIFVQKYKNSDQPLIETLKFPYNPSTKLVLLAMIIHKQESYTVRELNCYLNKSYTFDNYNVALKELIDLNAIIIVNKKIEGRTRKAFKINYDKYINIAEE